MKDEFWTKDEQIQKLKKELDFYKKKLCNDLWYE